MVCKLSYSQNASYSQKVPIAINHIGIKWDNFDILRASRAGSLNHSVVLLQLSLLLPLLLPSINVDTKILCNHGY